MSQEQYLTLDLVNRLAARFGPASRIAKELPGWLEYLTETECPERPHARAGTIWWKKVRAIAASLVPQAGGGDGEILQRNTAMIGSHFGLSEVETGILTFIALYNTFDGFEHVVDGALETREVSIQLLLSWFCNAAEPDIRAALRPNARLSASGLIQREGTGGRLNRLPFDLSDRISSALLSDVETLDELINIVFPLAPCPDAEWQDFEGVSTEAELLRNLLKRALSQKTPGVNILLYGPPGTGKTELAKVLAREVGARLRAVGETDKDGHEPSRTQRLSEMLVASRLLGSRSDTVLLFDEMEDLFGAPSFFLRPARMSKVHTNRTLETNPIPVIWTTNEVSMCDPAFLRRMSYSVMLRPPSGRVRARIWQRLETRHRVGLSETDLEALAERHEQPPAMVSDAMQVARLCDGGQTMVSRVLEAAAKLSNGGTERAPTALRGAGWLPELAQTDIDLAKIERRLRKASDMRQVSFCLEGPAGTGKSAWARHLARAIGLPVREKRVSDLLSKWVGGSEKNIAQAFADARSDGALLIFDEADSLLADRRNAQRSWEVSQVNEMLTWMERHPLPFICTTNFVERLDPATQRRFTFRIRFDFLSPAQLPLAWAAHFPTPAPTGLNKLDRLTPGDFANVARRMATLGEDSPEEILHELEREVVAKGGEMKRVGFGR